MADIPRQTLCDLIATQGTTVCSDVGKFEKVMMQECPRFRQQVQLLTHVLKAGVADEIYDWPEDADYNQLAPPIADRLVKDGGMAEDTARWALESWAMALGKRKARSSLNLQDMMTANQDRVDAESKAPPPVADPELEIAQDRARRLAEGSKHLVWVIASSALGGGISGFVMGAFIGQIIGEIVVMESPKATGNETMIFTIIGLVAGFVMPAIGGAFGGALGFIMKGGLKAEGEASAVLVRAYMMTICGAVFSGIGAILGGMVCCQVGMFVLAFLGGMMGTWGIASLLSGLLE